MPFCAPRWLQSIQLLSPLLCWEAHSAFETLCRAQFLWVRASERDIRLKRPCGVREGDVGSTNDVRFPCQSDGSYCDSYIALTAPGIHSFAWPEENWTFFIPSWMTGNSLVWAIVIASQSNRVMPYLHNSIDLRQVLSHPLPESMRSVEMSDEGL